jgi:hypothetical protein
MLNRASGLLRRGLLTAAVCFSAVIAGHAETTPSVVVKQFYAGTAEYPLAPRHALVIGVSTLKDGAGFIDLKNPTRDATHVSAALRRVGFSVVNLSEIYPPEQMTRQNIKKALYDLALILKAGQGVGLVYFSGHGIERNGQMYFAPHDAYVRYDRDFEEELIAASLIRDAFSHANNPLNFLIVDACRDNPWKNLLEQFGSSRPQAAAGAGSPNVILATSTLSGAKSLDGTASLSPYADAFVASLNQYDAGLSDFFGAIGIALHRVHGQFPISQFPAVVQPSGREFVFAPTTETFNQEQTIFQTGVSTGNRNVLQGLIWKYSGGYFHNAARYHLAHAPLKPTASVAITQIVKFRRASGVVEQPGASSRVVVTLPAGSRVQVTAQPVSYHPNRVAVELGEQYWSEFVKADYIQRFRTRDTVTSLQFEPTTKAGIETLTVESQSEIREFLEGQTSVSIGDVQVVGYLHRHKEGHPTNTLRLLTRQAAVIQALSGFGYDASKVTLATRETEKPEEADSIQLGITILSAPTIAQDIPSPSRLSAPTIAQDIPSPSRPQRKAKK